MTEETLNDIRTRPRFRFYTTISPEEFSTRLKERVAAYEEVSGRVGREVATIHVKTEHRLFWKPQLSLRFEVCEEHHRTEVRGVFGPSPEVWTFYVFMYAAFGLAALVNITFYYVGQMTSSGEYRWALPVAGFLVVMFVLTYLTSVVGKFFSKEEMGQLRQFAENTLLHDEIIMEE